MGYLLSRSRYTEERTDEYKKINCRQGYVQRGSACHPISRSGVLATASANNGTGTLAKLTLLAAGVALASKDPKAAAAFLALGVGAMVANKVIREKAEDIQTYKEFAKERENVAKEGIPARDVAAYSHLPKELAISTYAAERKIQHNDFETMFIFDGGGTPLLIRKGNKDSVSLGITDIFNSKSSNKGILMTHNHPASERVGETTLSSADLQIGKVFPNIKEIRATAATNTVVIQSKKTGSFSQQNPLSAKLESIHKEIADRAEEKWVNAKEKSALLAFQLDGEVNRKVLQESHSFLQKVSTTPDSNYGYKRFNAIANRSDSQCDRGKQCKGKDGQTYCIPKEATCEADKKKSLISAKSLATIGFAAASVTTLALIASAPRDKQDYLRQKAKEGLQVGEAILSGVKGRGGLGDRTTRAVTQLQRSSAGRTLQQMITSPRQKKNFAQEVGDFVTLKSLGRREKDKLKMLGYEVGSSLVGAFGGKVARDAAERTLSDSSLGQTEKTALLMFSDAATQYVGTKVSFAALQKASPSYGDESHPVVKIAIGIAARLAVEKAMRNKYEE
jgi:hypothetical protein